MRRAPAALVATLLAAGLGAVGCSESDPAGSVGPSDILALTAAASAVPADGVSATTVTAAIAPNASSANRTVTFTTTAGSLSGVPPAALSAGTAGLAAAAGSIVGKAAPVQSLAIAADERGRATVFLTAPTTPVSGQVAAQVATFARSLTIAFGAVGPTEIVVDPGQFDLDLGFANSLTVTATLRRPNGGVASQSIPVQFSARDSRGRSFGQFRAVTATDDCGQATAQFTAGDSAATGRATLVARATDPATGAVVEGTATVEIVDPDAAEPTG